MKNCVAICYTNVSRAALENKYSNEVCSECKIVYCTSKCKIVANILPGLL